MCRLIPALGLCLLVGACGDEARAVCDDRDGDGYGEGCARGPDCDDNEPRRTLDCSDAAVLADCEAEPLAPGCPCLRSEHAACFPGPADKEGVGPCRAGRVRCEDGAWGTCEDAVLPQAESCNASDDDCDGLVDEGVASPCGGCDDGCQGGVWGSAAAPFDASPPLALTAAGELTLRWLPAASRYLWVANTDAGSVSKLDTSSAQEVARYRTAGEHPIQVAVDHRGDAWVLDGGSGGRAQLSKIASETKRCRDPNGDGVRTSGSPADVLALGDDECVLLSVPLMASDDPRTLAVDGALAPDSARAGNVWIGCAGSRQLLLLDGESASELARYSLGELQPNASAFDAFGALWMIAREGVVLRFDPLSPEALQSQLVPYACYTLDALSIDLRGRLLLSGSGCERVFRYDPQRASWRSAQVPGLLTPRGVAAGADDSWVSYSSGQLAHLASDTLTPGNAISLEADGVTPFETFGLSAALDGQLWAISTQGGPDGVGLATRYDPEMERVTAQVPLGRGPRARAELGGVSGGEFAPEGRASHVFAGCGREAHATDGVSQAATEWLNLRVVALLGAGAKLSASVRRADSEPDLSDEPFAQLGELSGDGTPVPLQLTAGGVIELALTLESTYALGAPRVARVGVEWRCAGPD